MAKRRSKLAKTFVYHLWRNGERVAVCSSIEDAFVEASCYHSGKFQIQQLETDDGYTLIPSQEKRKSIIFDLEQNTLNRLI